MEESETGQVGNLKESVRNLAAEAVGFFRGGGEGANWNVVGTCMLDGERCELQTTLADHFLKTSKGWIVF